MRDLLPEAIPPLFPRRVDPQAAPTFEGHRFAAMLALGAVSFAVWLGVLFWVPPHRLLTYLAFFVPFWLAVASVGAAIVYMTVARRPDAHARALSNSVRRGALIASVTVALLTLLAGRHLTAVTFIIVVGCSGLFELIGWARAGAHE
ncbi:MAG TPA: hypothetical protein VG815_05825 [Chloroflexota bacterium]|nr:hypothetical protein [Chloroflexota bacterium]